MNYKVDSRPEGAREGDIPYYARWEDGSEYNVARLEGGLVERKYHGPQFGRVLGDWHRETEWHRESS